MDAKVTWTVVHFETDDTVEAVPTTWLKNDTCLWPPFSGEKLKNAIKNIEVNTDWPSYKVTVFKNATFEDYLTARNKAQKAEFTSDLNSDYDTQNNKRRCKKKVFSSSESEEEYIIGRKKLISPPKKRPLSLHNTPTTKQALTFHSTSTSQQNESPPKKRPLSLSHRSPKYNTPTTSSSQQHEMHYSSYRQSASTSHMVETPKDKTVCNNSCICCKKEKGNKKEYFILKNICCEILSKVENIASIAATNLNTDNFMENVLDQVGLNYPMTSIEDLNIFELFFKNEEKFASLVQTFIKMGGSTTGDFIRRCLAPLLSDNLAMQYSFIGRKGKQNFSILALCKAVLEAGNKIQNVKDRKECEGAIGCWLKRGKARKQLRENRGENRNVI